RLTYTHVTPQSRKGMTPTTRRIGATRTLEFGGPAVVGLVSGRPEALGPHLSVGLPLYKSAQSPSTVPHRAEAIRDRAHNTEGPADVRNFRTPETFRCSIN